MSKGKRKSVHVILLKSEISMFSHLLCSYITLYYNVEQKILKPSLAMMACHVMQNSNTRGGISVDKSGIPGRTSPGLTSSRHSASWFVIAQPDRTYASLNTFSFQWRTQEFCSGGGGSNKFS
jgi:hypothetical protein